jgi:hypothetical protein
MQKYRKKPVIIEAIKWTGNNYEEVRDFTNNKVMYYQWFQYNESGINEKLLTIETLEGKMEASIGDFIIKGVKGEFYPCKPDIFEMTYESI